MSLFKIRNFIIFLKCIERFHNSVFITFHTAHDGDYWRLLVPGTYTVRIVKEGYQPQEKSVVVENPEHTEAKRLDFSLQPEKTSKDKDVSAENEIDEVRRNKWSLVVKYSIRIS